MDSPTRSMVGIFGGNPLDVMVGTKLDIEDDDPYQLAIAIADYYRIYRWEEFCEFSKKIKPVARNDTALR